MAAPDVFSVSQIADLLKKNLETLFPWVWVRGEVSGVRKTVLGHTYFTLKDAQAQLSCAWFRNRILAQRASYTYGKVDPVTGEVRSLQRLPTVTPEILAQGGEFCCLGKISFYPQRGSCQMIVEQITRSGIGFLTQAFEALRQKLDQKGYFARERKRLLPDNPRRVALVTSEQGAAIKDFLKIARNRGLGSEIRLFPSLVQGNEAAQSLALAIQQACAQGWAEVVVVIRGGGSIEDLWCFNEEIVADAIFHATIPVLAGIGHEIDVTLADMTADVRAATPTHAAELLWKPRDHFRRDIALLTERMGQSMERMLGTLSTHLLHETRALRDRSPMAKLRMLNDRLAMAASTLHAAIQKHLERLDRGFEQLWLRFSASMSETELQQKITHIDLLQRTLIQCILKMQQGQSQALVALQTRLMAAMPLERLLKELATLSMLEERLVQRETLLLDQWEQQCTQLTTRLLQAMRRFLEDRMACLAKEGALLQSANPLALLGRGYAIVEQSDGSVVQSIADLSQGTPLVVRLRDGWVHVLVVSTHA
ncbi:MAG: exodeoxyribonuclease VII large subunit [Desulfovibrio sp.]|nr:exodeoxyribonuclease VII large subunit [Desulfovibrio sp.]